MLFSQSFSNPALADFSEVTLASEETDDHDDHVDHESQRKSENKKKEN